MTFFLAVVGLLCVVGILVTVKALLAKEASRSVTEPSDDHLELLKEAAAEAVVTEDLPGDDLSVKDVAMSKKDIWVVPFKTELDKKVRWAVKEEKTGEPLSLAVTQAEAEKEGRRLAKENKVELFVLGRNGEIRKKNSYGNDPENIKG